MKEPPSTPFVEVTPERAEETVRFLQEQIKRGGNNVESLRVALSGLTSYLKVCKVLSQPKITVQILRRMLGIVTPDPKPFPNKDEGKMGDKDPKDKPNGHGKRGYDDFPDADTRYFAHPEFDTPGCRCPECWKGKVFPEDGNFVRFQGQPFLKILRVLHEIWRCNLCQASFPAPIASDLVLDGSPERAFGFSAIAMIALIKYFFGTPWFRAEKLQSLLGLPVTASTLCDQCRTLSKALEPIYRVLFAEAAQGWLFYSDDTGIRILGLTMEVKTQRKTQKEVLRTGVHTSCVISELPENRRIILFKSGIIHAGEFLDEILLFRKVGLPTPLHMSDGSSCNPATVTETEPAACNAHAKRKVDEQKDLFPEHQAFIKAIYKKVYEYNADAKRIGMDPKSRLLYHQERSLPLMEKMFGWMQAEMDNKNVEPNSILGGIFSYFLVRKEKLMAFTKFEGAPIDNNTLEQTLKIVALLRKNAMFFKTLAGAMMSDVIMSIGATAGFHGTNLFHYFVSVLRYQKEVAEHPEKFLPWNYLKTIADLEKKAPTHPQVMELTALEWKNRKEGFAKSKIKPFPMAGQNTPPQNQASMSNALIS